MQVLCSAARVETWAEDKAVDVVLMLLITDARKGWCRRNWPILGRVLVLKETGCSTATGCTGSAEALRASRVVEGKRRRADER
jgi:hypothetical protein